MVLPLIQNVKLLIGRSGPLQLLKPAVRYFSSTGIRSQNVPLNCLQNADKCRPVLSQTELNALYLSPCRNCQLLLSGSGPTRTIRKTSSVLLTTQTRHNTTMPRMDKTSKSALTKGVQLKRPRKKPPIEENMEGLEYKNVAGYAVGSNLHLFRLKPAILQEDVYEIVKLPIDMTDVLMVTAKYQLNGKSRDIFFFSDGGVACWNMSETERLEIVKFSRDYAVNPYKIRDILEDSEIFPLLPDKMTKLVKNTIHLKTVEDESESVEELALEKFAFSNALALSVQLSVSENSLEHFIDQLEPETQRLRLGQPSKLSKKNINMMQGDIFLLRHEINLESGLLDTPDIYWERDDLEDLYKQMMLNLYIPKRIRVINERLNYCSEILGLFHGQLNDQHHVRLEWIIIILILIEVVFECIHLYDKYSTNYDVEDINGSYQHGQPVVYQLEYASHPGVAQQQSSQVTQTEHTENVNTNCNGGHSNMPKTDS